MQFNQWLCNVPTVHKRAFTEAYEWAELSEGVGDGSFKHGAVIKRGPFAISYGVNSYKTHPYLAKYTEFPFQHAETSAILRHGLVNFEKGDILYVIRIGRDGKIRMSKPCDTCLDVIRETDIYTVYYSHDCGYGVYEFDRNK